MSVLDFVRSAKLERSWPSIAGPLSATATNWGSIIALMHQPRCTGVTVKLRRVLSRKGSILSGLSTREALYTLIGHRRWHKVLAFLRRNCNQRAIRFHFELMAGEGASAPTRTRFERFFNRRENRRLEI